jgi:hypothetical protein
MRYLTAVVAIVALALAAPALSGKGGNGNGSGDGSWNGGGGRYSGTLTATPDVLRAGESFDVRGCGYETDLGNVVVGFTGGARRSTRTDASRSRASRRSRGTHFHPASTR